jgi:hypothetical protein
MKPFRWNIKKREQLGSLLVGDVSTFYPGYLEELRVCSAKVLAYSDNSKMVFVGRSAENILDYLTGILEGTPYEERLEHLNISNRYECMDTLAIQSPRSYRALKKHFELIGISPGQLMRHTRGICFVDLVSEGNTFDRLYEFIERWCAQERIDRQALWRKIHFLGITIRTKNSPNTYRWYQHALWNGSPYKITAKSISISPEMWYYMGNKQPKVTQTNPPDRWDSDSITTPPRDEEHFKALRLAYAIYSVAKKERKKVFAFSEAPREKWLKDILVSIRRQPAQSIKQNVQ